MTLNVGQRVAAWDAALAAVRACLRARGLFEVTTAVRQPAVAIEPYIDAVAAPPGWLSTSPELPMKRLLCHGAPSMFQVAHCLRRAEIGAHHAEEFHLVEWYRIDDDLPAVRGDVEAIVVAVAEAVAGVLAAPVRSVVWREESLLDLVRDTTGLTLRGDEDADELRHVLAARSDLVPPLLRPADAVAAYADPEIETLFAWTAFASTWTDACLQPRLAARPEEGVHVVDYPVALAALAEVGPGPLAHRSESHLGALEIANGYRELRDAVEQRRRFEVVARLRAREGAAPLPMPEAFLSDLSGRGLPRCAGAALGLDRVLTWAAGLDAIEDSTLHLR